MNGIRYFLDTNALISLLNGNKAIEKQLHQASWIGTSVVCIIEFLSFPSLTENDRNLLYILIQRIHVLPVENKLSELEQIARLRQHTKLKLPVAIIAATTTMNKAVLFSNDKHFSTVPDLSLVTF
jgi:predicted nucleic acid-binding protein